MLVPFTSWLCCTEYERLQCYDFPTFPYCLADSNYHFKENREIKNLMKMRSVTDVVMWSARSFEVKIPLRCKKVWCKI